MAALIQNMSEMKRVAGAGRTVFGDVVYRPGGSCGPRRQADFQIVCMVEGTCALTAEGQRHDLPSGHAALCRPRQREHFQFSPTAPTRHTWCAVDPALVSRDLRRHIARAPFRLPVSRRLHELMELGLSLAPVRTPVERRLVEQIALAVLWEFVAEAAHAELRDTLPAAVRRARDFAEANFSRPLALANLARAGCVTPQYLIRLFRRHLGTTPAAYLWSVRVGHGLALLRGTGLSISEIAGRCGFASPFHFSRLVRRRYGRSPKALRAEAWNPAPRRSPRSA